jgi:4-amino-4-deoxy-L-arabinose transferase-like glycosyltransferase
MKPLHAVAILLALFLVMSAVTWQTWATPEVDSGREMHTKLRLLAGERLYGDAYYLYGPVAPSFNAALYKVFGPHLNTLYAAGLIGSLLLVLMVFQIGRALMPTTEAMLAAAAVLLFSVFKQSGNLIFPYTYSALYGTCLATLALILMIRHLRSGRMPGLVAAAAVSGLALCCKLEFGFAAAAALAALAYLAPKERRARTTVAALGTFILVPVVVYGLVLMETPAQAVFGGTYLLPGSIPAELLHFNRLKLGLFSPAKTAMEMLSALALLGVLGGAFLLLGRRLAGEPIAWRDEQTGRTWRVIAGSLGWLALSLLVYGTGWDLNPMRALPLLLAAMAWMLARPAAQPLDQPGRVRLLVTVFGLAVLARVLIRVPGGGAYGSGLLPVPMILFFYLAAAGLTALAPAAAARVRRTVLVFFTVAIAAAAGVFAFRALASERQRLETARGDLRLEAPAAAVMGQALDFISRHSAPGQYILGLPEGSSLNFLGRRPAPLRYEILTPGFLDPEGEWQAVRALQQKDVPLVFLFNRPTDEFGPRVFGRDYYRILMGWIEENYDLAAVFTPRSAAPIVDIHPLGAKDEIVDIHSFVQLRTSTDSPDYGHPPSEAVPEIGDPVYFIKCYRRRADPLEPRMVYRDR